MSDTDAQTSTPPPAGFWKPRHALIGAGVLLLLVMGVRSCGDDADEDRAVKDVADDAPRQAIVVQIPAANWPPQGLPAAPPSYQAPVYAQPQAPVQQARPAMPGSDPGNPWAVPQASGNATTQRPAAQWGQPQRPQPAYVQPPGSARYRPLEDSSRAAPQPAAPAPAPVQRWPAAPYDRLSGSSFGNTAGGYPYPGGGWPGYYGATPYGAPPGVYGGGWPAPVYPGVGIQRPWGAW